MVNELVEAARAGNMYFVKSLIEQKKVDVNSKDDIEPKYSTSLGYTALHEAAKRGDVEMVSYLLANGAHVDGLPLEQIQVDIPPKSIPIMDYCDIVLENVEDCEGGFQDTSSIRYTPLSFAVSGGHVEVARLLLSKGARLFHHLTVSLLHRAILSNNYDVFSLILDQGDDDVNGEGEGLMFNWCSSHLSTAILHRKIHSVRCLLDRGADYKTKSSLGYNALFIALRKDPACLEVLLEFIDKEEGRQSVIRCINERYVIKDIFPKKYGEKPFVTMFEQAKRDGLHEVSRLLAKYQATD